MATPTEWRDTGTNHCNGNLWIVRMANNNKFLYNRNCSSDDQTAQIGFTADTATIHHDNDDDDMCQLTLGLMRDTRGGLFLFFFFVPVCRSTKQTTAKDSGIHSLARGITIFPEWQIKALSTTVQETYTGMECMYFHPCWWVVGRRVACPTNHHHPRGLE